MSIFYILRAILGLSDLESRFKVTGPYFQGHWNIKFSGTESTCATSLCSQISQAGSLHRI